MLFAFFITMANLGQHGPGLRGSIQLKSIIFFLFCKVRTCAAIKSNSFCPQGYILFLGCLTATVALQEPCADV